MRGFAEALVNNRLQALRVQAQTSGREFVLVEVTVHMAAVLLCGNLPLLQPLQRLALSPNNMMVRTLHAMASWSHMLTGIVIFLSCSPHRLHSSQLCLMTCWLLPSRPWDNFIGIVSGSTTEHTYTQDPVTCKTQDLSKLMLMSDQKRVSLLYLS